MKIFINDIHIAYDCFGERTPPLVLLHGFGLDRSIWHAITEQQFNDQQVILPDLRGHGESDAPSGPYKISLLAQDLAGLLEALRVEKAVVGGHSMGGYVALAFAQHYPHMLAGLALITTNAGSDTAEKRTERYALIESIREQGSAAVAENLGPRLSHNSRVVSLTKKKIRQTKPVGLIGALEGMATRADQTQKLTKIKVPALVVAGEDDQITNYKDALSLAQALPKGEFLGITGAGHMPMLETPKLFGQELFSWLDRMK